MTADSNQDSGFSNRDDATSSCGLSACVGEMSTQFLSLSVPLHVSPVVLRERVESMLRSHGDPLRWAITSVDTAQQIAQVEAVVTQEREVPGQKRQEQAVQEQGIS